MFRRAAFSLTSLMLIAAGFLSGCNSNAAKSGSAGSATTTNATASLTICAASDLKFALDDLLVDFRKREPGITVTPPSYGSSGTLFQQLQNEAPFDVYFSADIDYVRKLSDSGLIVPDSMFKYAEGRVVVWVRNDSQLDLGEDGKKALTDPTVKKIAVANPQTAPYGRAAVAALKHFGLYEQLESKFVLGENIAQTAQFIESGAADIGIIALSLASAPAMKDKGRYVALPKDAYPKLEQAAATLKWAKDKAAAERLRAFITSPEGRSKLQQYGFTTPGE